MIQRVRKLLSKDDLRSISEAIADMERTTSGEIRVSIREKKARKEQNLNVEMLARKEFENLGMSQTRERTGVLLFFLLENRQFYILADEGINNKVQAGTWELIANLMSEHFAKQNFREGIIQGVQAIGKALASHFPRRPNDTNELTNQVRVS